MAAVTRATAWERWRFHLEVGRRCSPRTVGEYRQRLWRFWASIEPKAWDQATAKDLDRFLRRPVLAHACASTHAGAPLAVKSQSGYHTTVSLFYRWAAGKGGLLRRDPMADVAAPKVGRALPRSLPLADVRRLVEHVAGRPDSDVERRIRRLADGDANKASKYRLTIGNPRVEVAVWLAYGCGLRAMEVAGLRAEDVHLGEHPCVRVVAGKGGTQRTIPLAPPVCEVLAAYLDGRPRFGAVVDHREWPGRHLSAGYVANLLGWALRAAGVSASGHQLRHTFATELLRAAKGANLYTVSKLLGHAHVGTTEVYVAAYPGEGSVEGLPDPRACGGPGAAAPG